MDRVTRRVFLKRSSLAVGVAGLAALPDVALAASSSGFTADRAQTYGSLVAVLAQANGLPHDEAHVAEATSAFAAWYGGAPPSSRRAVETVLDEIETIGGAFSDTGRPKQSQALRSWRLAPASIRDDRTTKQSARRRAVAELAFSLASPPYGAESEMKLPALTI